MNWIDKKVEGLKAHKEQQTKRCALRVQSSARSYSQRIRNAGWLRSTNNLQTGKHSPTRTIPIARCRIKAVQCTARLVAHCSVLTALSQEVLSNSVMPVLNLSAKATKHASLNKIRCDNRFGASVAEHTKGFSMTETKHRPTKSLEELERLMSQPGTVNSAIGVHPLIASGCRHDAR